MFIVSGNYHRTLKILGSLLPWKYSKWETNNLRYFSSFLLYTHLDSGRNQRVCMSRVWWQIDKDPVKKFSWLVVIKISFLCKNFLHSRALWVVPSLLYKKEKAPKFQILGCLDLCMLRLRREFVYKWQGFLYILPMPNSEFLYINDRGFFLHSTCWCEHSAD